MNANDYKIQCKQIFSCKILPDSFWFSASLIPERLQLHTYPSQPRLMYDQPCSLTGFHNLFTHGIYGITLRVVIMCVCCHKKSLDLDYKWPSGGKKYKKTKQRVKDFWKVTIRHIHHLWLNYISFNGVQKLHNKSFGSLCLTFWILYSEWVP